MISLMNKCKCDSSCYIILDSANENSYHLLFVYYHCNLIMIILGIGKMLGMYLENAGKLGK